MRILLVGLLVAGCTDAAMPDGPDGGSGGTCDVLTGSYHDQSMVVDGETRYYWVHVPASYHCEPTPLLVDFHGTAGDPRPEEAYQTPALEAFSEAHGVIVVRPRSRSSDEGGTQIYRWDQNSGDIAKNVAYTKQLVTELKSRYTLDAARMYASGFSSGSNMSAQFLGDLESPFVGLAPIAGGWWNKKTLSSLAGGPRVYMSTGYRDYLWPSARDLITALNANGIGDLLHVSHTGGGHDLYPWHFEELWQWLDGHTGFDGGNVDADWTLEAVDSPADITTLAYDGTTLLAAGAGGHVWTRGDTGWTADLSRNNADYTALCAGTSSAFTGGNFKAVERTAATWGTDLTVPDYGMQFGKGWVNAAACRDDGSVAVVGYWSSAIRTGTTWSQLSAPTGFGVDAQLAGVASTPGGATIVAGYYDFIGRAPHGETTATQVDHGAFAEWWNGVATVGGKFWVVGDGGAIITSSDDGVTWTAQTSGTTENLYSIAFADADHGAAVGRRGTVLVTSDGGTTWTPRPLGRDIFLGGVAVDDTTITVAGEGGLVARSPR